MKKLLSSMLCIVLICFALVGCGKEVIGEYLPHYEKTKLTDEQVETLNFYIITSDETVKDAKTTVNQNINTYLKEKYHIELNIEYCTVEGKIVDDVYKAGYEEALFEALKSTDESTRPDIVLINSADLYDKLYNDNVLLALNKKGDLDFFGNDYKKLNTIVDKALLSASATEDGTYYSVPNNHKIGYYEYVVINKEMARDTLHFPEEELASMTTEASLEELKTRILALDSTLNVDDYVRVLKGDYTDLQDYKKLDLTTDTMPSDLEKASEVNFVNIKAYPNATKEEAFLSAFAVIKSLDDTEEDFEKYTEMQQETLKSHYSNCMKIIYALNKDAEFKNMLQYGYVGTNYTQDKNKANHINLLKNDSVRYTMNNIYTGNAYISYYCDEISWDANAHDVWLRQNANAKTPMQKVLYEASAIDLGVTEVKPTDVLDKLPVIGTYYTDVTITWQINSESTNAVLENGVIKFDKPQKDVDVKIIATLECNGATYNHTFTIKLKAK